MKKEGDLIVLSGLEGNPRADTLTSSQEFLLPYADSLVMMWQILFLLTFTFVFSKFILIPLIRKNEV